MQYKGYTAKVEFDDEASIFHGQVLNLRDVITFQGDSVEALRHEFAESVEDYLEFCAERGEEPDKPCSGNFVVRLAPELHRDVKVAAELSGKSLNSWVVEVLSAATRGAEKSAPFRPARAQALTTEVTIVRSLEISGGVRPQASAASLAFEGQINRIEKTLVGSISTGSSTESSWDLKALGEINGRN